MAWCWRKPRWRECCRGCPKQSEASFSPARGQPWSRCGKHLKHNMGDRSFSLLGVDSGTTHCKAGLFVERAGALKLARTSSYPTQARRAPEGHYYYDPNELWETAAAAIGEVAQAAGKDAIAAIGIASMAETGLLVDRATSQPRSAFVPWFDTSSTPQVKRISQNGDPALIEQRFYKSGLYPSFKCSLAKILWLQDIDQTITHESTWLSAVDYIAYCLTGCLTSQVRTDYSLAGRTYAFDLNAKDWDGDWLGQFGLEPGLFPPARPAGETTGHVVDHLDIPGLPAGVPVSVAGHDHVCAAFALGVSKPGLVFDSMGTAESLVGALPEKPLGQKEFASGLSYGHHVIPDTYYWMGGLSTSGGSIEWLRGLLGEPPLSYDEIDALGEATGDGPSGILYFPYLAGSGSPHTDPLR
ncbi:MAG: hypothetical protein EHM70_22305, partial [Chloroflexota bacterium]